MTNGPVSNKHCGAGCSVLDEDEVDREVADAVVWLDDDQVQALLRLLEANDEVGASRLLSAAVPEVGMFELARWRDALIAELQFRVSPPDDQEDVPTREIPDYTRFAHNE